MRLASLVALLLAVPALAAELAGVKVEDAVTVSGKALKLNGVGLRRVFVFDVYVGALYLEHTTTDHAKILAADEARRFDMHMVRDVDQKALADSLVTAMKDNIPDKANAVRARMLKLGASFSDVKKGELITITYVPGRGTRIEGAKDAYVAEGKDFADALFSLWVGDKPVDAKLRKGVLGL